MAVRLTETAIKSGIKRAQDTGKLVELIDAATAGLRLRISPRGRRSWVVATRDAWGSLRRFPVGEYPELGISDARARAAVVRAEVKNGSDPIAAARLRRQAAKEGKNGINTLGALVNLYARFNGEAMKSWPEQLKRIQKVFAAQMATPLVKLTLSDLQMAADGYPAKQAASAAVRYLRPILKWASVPGRAYIDPIFANLKTPASPNRRDRILSREELARVLPVLRSDDRIYSAVLRFILLTLARREEAASARWRDIDLNAGTWIIPRTKNQTPHLVPLSRQARELLASIRPEDAEPLDLVFATRTGKRLSNFDKETRKIQAASDTAGWTRHDLRRTGATLLGDMGELPDIVEAALNHAAIHSQLASTYNKSRYRPHVAAALQRLADALDGIETGAGAIVPLFGVGGGFSG